MKIYGQKRYLPYYTGKRKREKKRGAGEQELKGERGGAKEKRTRGSTAPFVLITAGKGEIHMILVEKRGKKKGCCL